MFNIKSFLKNSTTDWSRLKYQGHFLSSREIVLYFSMYSCSQ